MSKCELCKSSKKDDNKYGEFLTKNGISVHMFCLYLTSNLCQSGDDDDGLFGFLPSDIQKETKRISRLDCFYCAQPYANIGCCDRKCRRTFHFICGLEKGAENQFIRTFKSFCHQHIRKINYRPALDETCCICYDKLLAPGEKFRRYEQVNMLRAPCCCNGWFHKLCLQTFAKTAGYFFKCPLCNDTETFREKLAFQGIFIPNRDAAWELEPNAYAELLERPNTCTAEICKNKQGREHADESRNPLLLCTTCGSAAMHQLCITDGRRSFQCSDCKHATCDDSGRESFQSILEEANDDKYDTDVDVCNDSDDSQTLANANENDESEDEIKRIKKTTVLNRKRIIFDDESNSDTDNNKPLASAMRTKANINDSSDDSAKECEDSEVMENRKKLLNWMSQKRKMFDDSLESNKSKGVSLSDINGTDDDDNDDDPLENFNKYVDKQNLHKALIQAEEFSETEASIDIVPRMRRRANCKISDSLSDSSDSEATHSTQAHQNTENQNILEISCIARRTRRKSLKSWNKDGNSNNNDSNALDINSIGKRTRRRECFKSTSTNEAMDTSDDLKNSKTNCSINMESNLEISEEQHSSNALDISCVAKRTRRSIRSSVAAVDDHTGDDDTDSVSSASMCSYITAISTPCENVLNISCIANRTRKRKSINSTTAELNLYSLDEVDEFHECKDNNYSSQSSLIESSASSSCSSTLALSAHQSHLKVKLKRLSIPEYRVPMSTDDSGHTSAVGSFAARLKQRCSNNSFDPYKTPKFTRVNGKLKRVYGTSTSSTADQLNDNLAISHNTFSRSYNFLVDSGSEEKTHERDSAKKSQLSRTHSNDNKCL